MEEKVQSCGMDHYCILCNNHTGITLGVESVRRHILTVKLFWNIEKYAGPGLAHLSHYAGTITIIFAFDVTELK